MTRILWHISTKKLPKMLEYTLGRVGFSDFFLNFEYLNIFLLEYNRSAHLYIFKFHSYLEICLLFLMQKLNNYKIWIISTNKLPKGTFIKDVQFYLRFMEILTYLPLSYTLYTIYLLYARNHRPLLIRSRSWIQAIHKAKGHST